MWPPCLLLYPQNCGKHRLPPSCLLAFMGMYVHAIINA